MEGMEERCGEIDDGSGGREGGREVLEEVEKEWKGREGDNQSGGKIDNRERLIKDDKRQSKE